MEDESDTDNETISKNFDTKKGKAIEHKMFLCGEYDDYYNDNNNDDNEDDDDDHHISRWLATCARKPRVSGSSPAATYV